MLQTTTLQSQHDDLEAKFFEERAALEAKYQKLYQPLYTKVKAIVHLPKLCLVLPRALHSLIFTCIAMCRDMTL